MILVRNRRLELEGIVRELLAFEQRFMGDFLFAIGLMTKEDQLRLQKLSFQITDEAIQRVLIDFAAEEDGSGSEVVIAFKPIPMSCESDLDIPMLEHGSSTFEQSAKATAEERAEVWQIGPTTISVFVLHEMVEKVLDNCEKRCLISSDYFTQNDLDRVLIRLFWTQVEFEKIMRVHARAVLQINAVVVIISEEYRDLLGDEVPWEIRDDLTDAEAKKFRMAYSKRFKTARTLFKAWLKAESTRIYG